MPQKEKSLSEFVDEQVLEFKPLLVSYEKMKDLIIATLTLATSEMGYSTIIQGRTKEVRSFAEKCIRKRGKYLKPAHTFTDLCGVRVIVDSKDQVDEVCRYIRENFEIDEANSEDVAVRLQAYEFGYLSHHFIVSLKPGAHYPEPWNLNSSDVLLERRGGEEAEKDSLPPGPRFKAEIQVRTLLQHAWATIIHDNLYKTELKDKPRHLEREAGKIASLLEDSDDSFVRLLNGVNEYKSSYGSYMKPEEIKEEMEILGVVQKHDSDNEALAQEIARLAIVVGDWEKARSVLDPFKKSRNPAINRDLGFVLWNLGHKEDGRALLRWAVHPEKGNPGDSTSWCALGDIAFDERDYMVALQHFRRAFEEDSTSPRALGSYLKCEIIENNSFDFLPLMDHNLIQAIESSFMKVRHGVHLPWAWYDIGFFNLLLGNQYESLAAYGMAVQLSSTMAPIEATLKLLDHLMAVSVKIAQERTSSIYAVRWFVALAAVAKVWKLDKGAISQNEAVEKYLREGKIKLAACPRPVSGLGDSEEAHFSPQHSMIIVAGGCDASIQAKIGEYQYMVNHAFMGFEGTIISGGTTAGIPGMVGDLENQKKLISRVAYLPRNIPNEDSRHNEYEIFRTTGGDVYGPIDVIQLWCDILISGTDLSTVRLLGINGGSLSMFEYQVALIMGAQVGVLYQSGRAATQVANDKDWGTFANLLLLPTDEETVRNFANPVKGTEMITSQLRETMAIEVHQKYCANREKNYLKTFPEISSWDNLSATLKNSNYSQVDHMEEKLRRAGLCATQVDDRDIVIFDLSDQPELVEELSEAEHGRWNVERLLDGWRQGDVKNEKLKLSPYLVAWRDLPEEIKKYDREAVLNMPQVLASHGLEVQRLPKK